MNTSLKRPLTKQEKQFVEESGNHGFVVCYDGKGRPYAEGANAEGLFSMPIKSRWFEASGLWVHRLPPAVSAKWNQIADDARHRIALGGGFNPKEDPETQIAQAICAHGDLLKRFIGVCARGRVGRDPHSLRVRLIREVRMIHGRAKEKAKAEAAKKAG